MEVTSSSLVPPIRPAEYRGASCIRARYATPWRAASARRARTWVVGQFAFVVPSESEGSRVVGPPRSLALARDDTKPAHYPHLTCLCSSASFLALTADTRCVPAVVTLTIVRAPVAQLDRASDYGSEGWEFESLRARCREERIRISSASAGRGAARLARLVRDQEVGGSNPLAPTISKRSSPGLLLPLRA